MRLSEGQQAPDFSTKDISGVSISLADYRDKKLMLCFLRYAGCPYCNYDLQVLISQYPKFRKQGLNIIAFFQSKKEAILAYPAKQNPPFPIVADPLRNIYDLYKVDSSFAGFVRGAVNFHAFYTVYIKKKFKQGKIDGDLFLMPAYFLIGQPNFTIHKARYAASFAEPLPLIDIQTFLSFSE